MPDPARRLLYLRIAIAIFLFTGMAFSYKLWLTARAYPLTPVFSMWRLPAPFDAVLLGAALLSLIGSAISPRLIPIFAVLAVVLVLFDQSRLQPWFVVSVFLLVGLALHSPNGCRLALASTYFWMGIFLFEWPPAGQWVPYTLFIIGIMLLSKKFRTLAIIAAIAVHSDLLITHSALIFWPWNIALPVFLILLFYETEESPRHVIAADSPFHIVVVFFITLAPLLSFMGKWDQSANHNSAEVYLSHNLIGKLPAGVKAQTHAETPEIDSIDVNRWSLNELHTPPYPQIRIYKNIGRQMCKYATEPGDVRLSIRAKSPTTDTITSTSYSCLALK